MSWLLLVSCLQPTRTDLWSADADPSGHTAPTAHTRAVHAAAPTPDDPADDAEAVRGLVAAAVGLQVHHADGRLIWDTEAYRFLDDSRPDAVHPSLWRQARLNSVAGLFRVTEGIHQLRGFDLANMTLIDSDGGWIVVDPLTSEETAAAALAFARQHLGDRAVTGVILTHSHIDHFGGVGAVLPDGDEVPVVAPEGFLVEATRENMLAGLGMARRSAFMYGMPLDRSARGHVDAGLGKAPGRGTVGIATPSVTVDHTGRELVLDGVRFVFQHVPDSEAPAELTFSLPERKAWCGAELVSHTMHNLYTLRGAKVRDAMAWSGFIDEARLALGDTEVAFASHHWPVWGHDRIDAWLTRQRDVYRYTHDQTLRLANGGATPSEIAEQLQLPTSLTEPYDSRGYYGTLRHNARAVYQAYFGWYDGNPAHLDPLPPADAGPRYVEAMGGADAVLDRAQTSFEAGDYRWTATLLDHLVFAEPDRADAAELLARAYDQLGYQAESAPWRDVYLTGALELRHGVAIGPDPIADARGMLQSVPVPSFLDAIAVRLDGAAAEGRTDTITLVITDEDAAYSLSLDNGVLHHRLGADDDAVATVRLTHDFLIRLMTKDVGLMEAIGSDELEIQGSTTGLVSFLRLFTLPDRGFPIVTP